MCSNYLCVFAPLAPTNPGLLIIIIIIIIIDMTYHNDNMIVIMMLVMMVASVKCILQLDGRKVPQRPNMVFICW